MSLSHFIDGRGTHWPFASYYAAALVHEHNPRGSIVNITLLNLACRHGIVFG